MNSNLERFQKDLEALIKRGGQLHVAIQAQFHPDEIIEALKQGNIEDPEKFVKKLPSFELDYQSWYSEAQAVVRQILPDRLTDFVSHYQKPKSRKQVTYETYRIEDYFQGLTFSQAGEKIAGPDAAIPHFLQQLLILKSAKTRFESSLYDIRQVVQADLFDSELDAAEDLAKKKFLRASGAMVGVVLEKHLSHVCENHQIKVRKSRPTISDFNDLLKAADVIDVPQWRFIQHLGDIRNICDHSKAAEPTTEQVNDLLAGVRKISKMLF